MAQGEIVLVPVGADLPEVCTWLSEALPPLLGRACSLAPPLPHPTFAWDARRRQYLAGAILAHVQPGEASSALAVADLDLYVPGLNFVFGLADPGAARAIIALPRLRQSFYGLSEDDALFRERVLKEAVHELGHVYGLRHCPERRCVMAFSNSLRDTDDKTWRFCPRCLERLALNA